MIEHQARRDRIEGPPLTRTMQFRADGILSEEERRIRVTFSSELPVTRASWFRDAWVETLGHESSEVDLSRMDAGAPALYNHDRWDKENRIGVVEKAWLKDGKGHAEIRLSRRSDVDGIWQDVRDGILCNVSVGYQINERTLIQSHDDSPDEYRVTKWTPLEISLVDIPADHTVGVGRAAEQSAETEYRIIPLPDSGSNQRGNAMSDEDKKTEQKPETSEETRQTEITDNTVNLDDVRAKSKKDGIAAERTRVAAIRGIFAPFGDRFADLERSAIADGWSEDQTRKQMLDKMGEDGEPLGVDTAEQRIEAGADELDKRKEGVSNILLARSNVRGEDGKRIRTNDNPWRGMTLMDLARASLARAGINHQGMDKRDVVARAFTQSTSDFPVLLEEAMHKALLSGYRLAIDTWSRFCVTGSVSDFRAHNRYMTGSLGNLDALTELGEFENKTIPDGRKESVSISTKGNIINISRQAIIDDDLGAFVGLSQMLGRAGRRTIESTVYSTLALNSGLGPTLSDTKTLFHADHGNIGTGAALSVASIDSDRVLMANQTDVSGNDYLDLRPSILLIPVGLGGAAREINAQEYNDEATKNQRKPNSVRGLYDDIVDTPRLSGTARYSFADPNEAPVMEVSFLDGEDEPFLDMEEGFTVDGARYKARLDFGVSGVGYEGAVRNAGA